MHNVSSSLIQLGLSEKIREKLNSVNVSDVDTLCSYSEPQLRALGLNARQTDVIEKCLSLAHRALDVPQTDSLLGSAEFPSTLIEPVADEAQAEPVQLKEELTHAIGELLERSDLIVPDFGQDLFEISPKPDRQYLNDDERAMRAAAKVIATAAGRPTLNHPRVIDLLDSITMTVEDAAFLLNRSKDAVYDALAADPTFLPMRRVGRSINVFSQPFLRQLGLK